MKQEKSITYYCTWGNTLHLVVCAACYALKGLDRFGIAWVQGVILGIDLLIWTFIGIIGSLNSKKNSTLGGFPLGLSALLPILVLMGLSMGLSMSETGANNGWTLFYFIGAPLQFWCRPSMIIVSLMTLPNAYLLFGFYFILIFFSINCGYIWAEGLKTKKGRVKIVRRKASEKKVV